jgi:hypothetical protein
MQQALDALELLTDCYDGTEVGVEIESIIALRERLAQPEQEPFEYWNAVEGWVKIDEVRNQFGSVGCGTIYKTAGEDRVPLYTAPPQRTPLTEQEPVAWRNVIPGGRKTDEWDSARVADYNQGWNDYRKAAKAALEKLYTAPPQRKLLTDEEIADEWEHVTGHNISHGDKQEGHAMYISPDEVAEFARAVIAKVTGEKK